MSARALRKPLLSKVNRKKRLDFAKKFRECNFKKTIFSDETIFRVRPGGHVRCWRPRGESKFTPKYLVRTVQKPEGLMVWAAMKSDGSICVRHCTNKVNAAEYQQILGSALSFIHPRCP